MNDVGGQQVAVGVARYKQNVMSFIDLIDWTRKYPVKDTVHDKIQVKTS